MTCMVNSSAEYINRIDKLNVDFEAHLKEFENHVKNQDKETKKLDALIHKKDEEFCHEIGNIHHVINVHTVIRDDSNYMDIKSIIRIGDITTLSEKKFSKFTRWLYKKLFGWTIEDYEWAKSYQRRIFPC